MSGARLAPRPGDATTPIEFVAHMRRLQQWSGLTLDELEARATVRGDRLPAGRLAVLLDHDIVPPREMAVAFVRACGCTPAVQREWTRVHERVTAMPSPNAPVTTVTEPRSDQPPGAGPGDGTPTSEGSPAPADHGPRHSRAHRRHPVSLLVMAPVLITFAIVGISLWPGGTPAVEPGATPARANTGAESTAPGEPATPGRTTAPGATISTSSRGLPVGGWYTVHPTPGGCLSVLPDNDFRPTLATDACIADDTMQRFRFESGEGGVYTIKGSTMDDDIWCATVDSRSEGALIHLTSCDPNSSLQRFTVTSAGASPQRGPLFRMRPQGDDGMCVGLGTRVAGTAQAMQIGCERTGILEYTLSPVASPTGS
ncbi:hypothetical protein [Actinomadura alba]|uniref:Ricin B lectin domain-containing protein n=1 Tax=Actinomadura alba TaxID=406431 RepID=A0ABR7LHL2_9ACTN|nr:hypothetical protein [Actinomadura alba]MBC6464327.1 hypothetical protein [Actinomadura alba]